MYVVVVGILSIVLILQRPVYRLLEEPAEVLAAAAAATLVPAVLGVLLNRRVLRLLDRDPAHPGNGQHALNRGQALLQLLLGLLHAGLLLLTDWLPLAGSLTATEDWVLLPRVLALVPFLVAVLLVWTALFPADRAVRQIALEVYLLRGRPLRPVWTLPRYLVYHFRHQVLFILVPMLLILAASDIVMRYEDEIRRATGRAYAPDVLIGLVAVGVAVAAPEILRRIWVTQRLPAGPLRDRLELLCRRLRLRCRDILVWRSGGMVVNAAVMGIVAPLRYVLITDAMLEQMDDTRIEAVFGHEAGHVKHGHIPYFLLFALLSGCLITVFARDLLLLGALLVVQWGLVFGWISRHFERQADIFGVRTLTLTGLPCGLPCAVHGKERGQGIEGSRDQGTALCSTAASVFGQALYDVALLNGIEPEARSWRHSSIASRSRFLQQLAHEPVRHRRFQRRVRALQAAIVVAAAIGSVWAAQELGILRELRPLLRLSSDVAARG